MRELTNEDIANIIFEAIALYSIDHEIKDSILKKYKDNEELHEQICETYHDIAEEYFIQGYLMGKK